MTDATWIMDGVLRPLIVVAGALVVGLLLHWVCFFILARVTARTGLETDDLVVRHARRPMRLIAPLVVLFAALPAAGLGPEADAIVRRIAAIATIVGLAWLVIAGLNFFADVMDRRFDMTQADNLVARRMHTQVNVIRKICIVVVFFLAGAAILMTFPSLRHLGLSLFASAGVAGIVVGLAARPTLSNMIAGIQIALTDPIRIDDVVIVEGEWGWIEEINLTYVVIRVWDLRRLVVPLSNFVEKPFQNWTRTTADILGTVFLYTDYTVPVEEVRAELRRIVEGNEHWDGKVCGLQVTNTTDRTVELRALVSAASSPAAWELRCLVRERLVAFLQQRYPDSLPRVRAELRPLGPGDGPVEAGGVAA